MNINPRDVQLKITASRHLLELGEPWELFLEIENDTEIPLWISGMTTILAIPVEVIHPSEIRFNGRWSALPTIPGDGKNAICILPKGKYLCTWRLENSGDLHPPKPVTKWQMLAWHVFFHPGYYDFFATVHIWDKRPDMQTLEAPKATPAAPDLATLVAAQAAVMDESLCKIASGKIEVVTKSGIILGAASLGGVIAFLFKTFTIAQGGKAEFSWLALLSLPVYVLTAAVVSLVVSRITEAKFPLTIKVMDFWGGAALGIIAAISGNYFLNSIFEHLAVK